MAVASIGWGQQKPRPANKSLLYPAARFRAIHCQTTVYQRVRERITHEETTPSLVVRTGDRVVEGTSLENWHRGNSIEGSNPSLSARSLI